MKRRKFLKLTLAISSMVLAPKYIYASTLDISKINFNISKFNENLQTIIIFLAGGPCPLSGNLSNLEEINSVSQNDYNGHFGTRYLTKIEDYNLWKQAGGEHMKNMLENEELTIFRACYSKERELVNNKAHGVCSQQNMNGNYDIEKPGILTALNRVMEKNNLTDSNKLQFMTLIGKNGFYKGDDLEGLNPISIDYKLSNPFDRKLTSHILYTKEEKKNSEYKKIDPKIDNIFDNEALIKNNIDEMNSFINNRKQINDKIKKVSEDRNDGNDNDKNLSEYGYTENDRFHQTLATAIELLDSNAETRTITIGTSGLGGWDDHSYCKINYTTRMQNLFKALEASMRHLDGINKKGTINIMVFGEFGRNVNLNTSFGWDHGNLQNLFILGGTDYFNHFGGLKSIIGETIVDDEGKPKNGRVWLKPKEGTYIVNPMSIASTIYHLNGIENPEELTGGYGVINPIVDGVSFIK